jgi:hypothetical protein
MKYILGKCSESVLQGGGCVCSVTFQHLSISCWFPKIRQRSSDFEVNNEFTVGSGASSVILVRARECKMLLSVIMSTCVLNQCQCAEDFDDSAPAPCATQKEKSNCVLSMKSEFQAAALERQNQLASEYCLLLRNSWRRWPTNMENIPTCSSRSHK